MEAQELKKMVESANENWEFDVADNGPAYKSGLETIETMSEETVQDGTADQWLKDTNDFDGLSDWAYELGVAEQKFEENRQ